MWLNDSCRVSLYSDKKWMNKDEWNSSQKIDTANGSAKKFNMTRSLHWLIGLVGRVFANGLGDLGSIPSYIIPKT